MVNFCPSLRHDGQAASDAADVCLETGQMSSAETGQMSAVPESSGLPSACGGLRKHPQGFN